MADPNGYADDDEFAEHVYTEMLQGRGKEAVEDGDSSISEEDGWRVISSHFYERGLVSQQLDSFDVFMTHTMQVSYYRVPVTKLPLIKHSLVVAACTEFISM